MLLSLALLSTALADPCGMVPPAWIPSAGGAPPIERVGDQQTYVFYADGIETIAIRPGFTGSVDEFGMLVPIPSAPALRKIGDATFTHLEAAVDAPMVTVNLYDDRPRPAMSRASRAPMQESPSVDSASGLAYDAVRVVNQEAMGMYEVAVLEAGSPKALERWMTERDYSYPKGMDDVVRDYVEQGWLFIAIKAKVGQLAGVEPRPGMRNVNPALPSGASFNGYVQGMAFRFRVDEPVVPMRLSTFNGDSANNIVYMLADRPVRVEDRDVKLVKRQVSGRQLYENVAGRLPVTYQNGTQSDLADGWMDSIEAVRDPAPYSSVARDLMAADMLALDVDELALPFEKEEKELLNINEALGLRGASADERVEQAIKIQRDVELSGAVTGLRSMTLTVLDGDFGQSWLRSNNLRFARYEMPASRNDDTHWTRRPAGPQIWAPRKSSSWVPW